MKTCRAITQYLLLLCLSLDYLFTTSNVFAALFDFHIYGQKTREIKVVLPILQPQLINSNTLILFLFSIKTTQNCQLSKFAFNMSIS